MTKTLVGTPDPDDNHGCIAWGNYATASGQWAVAIGNGSTASGSHAVAIGHGACAVGENTVAVGNLTTWWELP